MSTENPVFSVLVTKGNQAVLPAGQRPETLAVGQVGVFSYDTGLSLDASSSLASAREFYLGLGVDMDGDGVLDGIRQSAGHKIERSGITAVKDKCSTGALGKIVQISNIVAKCETEYIVKIEVSNQMGFLNYGPSLIYKTFNYFTGCCAPGCTTGDCSAGHCVELALGLASNINEDEDNVFVATLWDATNSAAVAFADAATWAAANPTLCLDIRIETEPFKLAQYCSVNLGYFYPTGTNINVALKEGFYCNGTLTTIREMTYAEGDGVDVQQEEYVSLGYTHSPYRLDNTGVGPYINYLGVKGTKYTMINITHRATVVEGWQTTKDNQMTCIRIPCADATTLAGLKAVLNPLVMVPSGYTFVTTTCACQTDEVPPIEQEATAAEIIAVDAVPLPE